MPFTALEKFFDLVGDEYGGPGIPQREEQRGEYESGTVTLDSVPWRVRTARLTPKKPGAFVAVWQRDETGETRPFASGEAIAGLLVFVLEGERFGVFRFTAEQLKDIGVTSSSTHAGKRGFRVYPSWSTNLNRQATRTQAEQSPAFTRLS